MVAAEARSPSEEKDRLRLGGKSHHQGRHPPWVLGWTHRRLGSTTRPKALKVQSRMHVHRTAKSNSAASAGGEGCQACRARTPAPAIPATWKSATPTRLACGERRPTLRAPHALARPAAAWSPLLARRARSRPWWDEKQPDSTTMASATARPASCRSVALTSAGQRVAPRTSMAASVAASTKKRQARGGVRLALFRALLLRMPLSLWALAAMDP
mmetsp:Transcript_41495/g.88309  ORF Transcript_41495/g.88309 Transcript_41495/m.88309 type:complete len:214 (+) Transcript_41495:118-759(+)